MLGNNYDIHLDTSSLSEGRRFSSTLKSLLLWNKAARNNPNQHLKEKSNVEDTESHQEWTIPALDPRLLPTSTPPSTTTTTGSGGTNVVSVDDIKPPAPLSMLKELSIKRKKLQIVSSFQQISSSKLNKEEGESFLDALEAVLAIEKKKKNQGVVVVERGGKRVERTTRPPRNNNYSNETTTTTAPISNTVPEGVTIESVIQILQNREELEKDPERWIELQTSLQHATNLLLMQAKHLSTSGKKTRIRIASLLPTNTNTTSNTHENVEDATVLISTLALTAVPLVSSLRSTLVKAALQLFQAIFHQHGHCINNSRTLGIITPMLLRRSGGTGGGAGAGKQRDTFLCMEADLTLTSMIEGVPGTKALEALMGCLASSCSSQVAAYKLAMHIDAWIKKHGITNLIGSENKNKNNYNNGKMVTMNRYHHHHHHYHITNAINSNINSSTLIVKLRSAGEGFCKEKSADVRKLGRQIMGQLDALSLL